MASDIEALAASSAYNDAASLAESENTEDLIAAAARWEQTAHEHAGTDVAPVALYDAAETYGKAGSINDAVRLFQELAITYPSYENAPNGLLRAAYLLREDGLFLRGEADMVLSYTTSPAYHLIAENDSRFASAQFDRGHYMQIEVAGTHSPENVYYPLGVIKFILGKVWY